ncbi:MAG: esterase-like activity of phytase family protein [Nitrospirae bacterium]|nr:esterase-like activity of phytase family protein [Nitrospirota bacterium]
MSLIGAITAPAVLAAPEFVNGLALDGAMLDRSGGKDANTGRVGYFSDIYYDPQRGQWWGLSDRGPGGGALHYETRVQRFGLTIDKKTGAISKFKIRKTVIFSDEFGNPMDGIAPAPTNILGNAFDPEGFVIGPKNGSFYVSDEYGPSLYEFNKKGKRVRTFTTPANLIPRNGNTPNYAGGDPEPNTAGKRTNRGFEGLAIIPDGDYIYAMLQSAMLDEGAGSGVCNRIVKFSTATGTALAQYAYQMEGSSQGRGISALFALNDHEFLVLERNNRGIGVGAEFSPPNKKIYRIDLTGAADFSLATFAPGPCPAGKVIKAAAPFLDLTANTLPELGNKVPEKWEGLAIGPRLNNDSYLLLAGTDNDYSVTQNAGGTQFDVYFRVDDADPFVSSIQCPLGSTTGCFQTTGGAPAELDGTYKLLPGILHAYKVPRADLGNFVRPGGHDHDNDEGEDDDKD